MVRRIASGAALVALMVCLSACQCGKGATASSAKSGSSGASAPPAAAGKGAGGSGGGDMYRGEQDRDMGRLK